jgi:hypothetical protein
MEATAKVAKKTKEAKTLEAPKAKAAPKAERVPKAEVAQAATVDLFSVDAAIGGAADNKKSKSKKDIRPIAANLKTELKLAVAGKRIIKAVEKKCEIASLRLKSFFVREWATKFVRTGQVPSSVQYTDGDTSIDFVPTKRIHIRQESIEALQAIGVPIKSYLEVSDVNLDFQVLKDYGFAGAAQEALRNIPGMTDEILKKVIQPKLSPKESLYADLAKIAKDSLGGNASEEAVIDRMILVTDLVNPVSQIRNAADPESLGDAIDYVASTEIEATPEEDEKINKKKKWSDE